MFQIGVKICCRLPNYLNRSPSRFWPCAPRGVQICLVLPKIDPHHMLVKNEYACNEKLALERRGQGVGEVGCFRASTDQAMMSHNVT